MGSMTQTMPEKLELIAKCIREGREVEVKYGLNDWKHASASPNETGDCTVLERMQYRAKPERPRMGILYTGGDGGYEAVQLTPEVRQALKAAGVDYE